MGGGTASEPRISMTPFMRTSGKSTESWSSQSASVGRCPSSPSDR